MELIVSGLEVLLSEVPNNAPEKVCNFHSAAKHLHQSAWPHLQTLICEVPKYSSAEQLVGSLSVQQNITTELKQLLRQGLKKKGEANDVDDDITYPDEPHSATM